MSIAIHGLLLVLLWSDHADVNAGSENEEISILLLAGPGKLVDNRGDIPQAPQLAGRRHAPEAYHKHPPRMVRGKGEPARRVNRHKPDRTEHGIPFASGSHNQAENRGREGKKEKQHLVRQRLEAFKFYPFSARRRGIGGQVDVSFSLDGNGQARNLIILAGSGYAVLDQAARQTVRRAQPFAVRSGEYRFRLRFGRL